MGETMMCGQLGAPPFASGEGWGTDAMHGTLSTCPGDFVGMMSGIDLFPLRALPTIIASPTSKGGGAPAEARVEMQTR